MSAMKLDAKMVVPILLKELESKLDELKYKKLEVMQLMIKTNYQ